MKQLSILFIITLILMALSLAVLSLQDRQLPASIIGGQEQHSPGDWIKEGQISVYNDRVILELQNPLWASFTDTNSMDPYLDETSNAIEIQPNHPDDIVVGDIIAYKTGYGVLVHRVIEKGSDEHGVYYIVKGDNNQVRDPFKVRFQDIEGVVVAIIY